MHIASLVFHPRVRIRSACKEEAYFSSKKALLLISMQKEVLPHIFSNQSVKQVPDNGHLNPPILMH
jgi:hypothetical protein